MSIKMGIEEYLGLKLAETCDLDLISLGEIMLRIDPGDVTPEMATEAKLWLWRAGLTDKEIEDYGFAFDNRSNRMVLPLYDHGDLVGSLSRRLDDSDGTPKYIMYGDKYNGTEDSI